MIKPLQTNRIFNFKERLIYFKTVVFKDSNPKMPTPNASLDPSFSWNGTVNGKKAQVGAYVWYCELVFLDGTTQLFKGDVTLIR